MRKVSFRTLTNEEYKDIGDQLADAHNRLRNTVSCLTEIIEKGGPSACCAASVILYAHFKTGPVYDLYLLDEHEFECAMLVIKWSKETEAGLYGPLAYGKHFKEALIRLDDIVTENVDNKNIKTKEN